MTLRRTLMMSILALPFLALPAVADQSEERARSITMQLLGDAHQALNGGSGASALRSAIMAAFNFDVWENFLLQKHEDAFSDQQMTEFRTLLPGYMAHLYRDQFNRGLSVPPDVNGTRKVRRDTLVTSTFPRPNGGELPVDWRVREFPDRGAQVIDVMVAGTSFLTLKREEFESLIKRGGPEVLLDFMRQNAI